MKLKELFERYDAPPPAQEKFDERRQYIVNADWKVIDSFMSMEAATRAIRNNPKKFIHGEFFIKSGKDMNAHFDVPLE